MHLITKILLDLLILVAIIIIFFATLFGSGLPLIYSNFSAPNFYLAITLELFLRFIAFMIIPILLYLCFFIFGKRLLTFIIFFTIGFGIYLLFLFKDPTLSHWFVAENILQNFPSKEYSCKDTSSFGAGAYCKVMFKLENKSEAEATNLISKKFEESGYHNGGITNVYVGSENPGFATSAFWLSFKNNNQGVLEFSR